jgi:hypothetical protein
MIGLLLAAWLCAAPVRAEAVGAKADVHADLNAVRRARYALRKAKPGTPEEEAAKKELRDAKKKLKDDRLKARSKK